MPSVPLMPSLASAIPTITWPLGPFSCPPLYFESLEKMKETRMQQSLNVNLVSTLSTTLEEVTSNVDLDTHFGFISVALVLIGNGLTDEAHDLVTPLSWPQDLHFGHGPSVFASVQDKAKSFATYVHCLVHRREGFQVGEIGMVGFQNANYWSNALANSMGFSALPHEELFQNVLDLHHKTQFQNVPAIQKWYQDHGITEKAKNESYWETRAVHELCAAVLSSHKQSTREEAPVLQEFAECVAETELRVVLKHALVYAGFATNVENGSVPPLTTIPSEHNQVVVDANVALGAANKVSSAHLQAFRSNGSVVIRSVLGPSSDESLAHSIAAGIAARLLGEQAVTNLETSDAPKISIVLPSTLNHMNVIQTISHENSGGPLSIGDVQATSIGPNQRALQAKNPPYYTFYPCNPSNACFVDTLHDARGETPTTVVQWSKGTIF